MTDERISDERLTRPHYKTYPAHGSGFIAFYDVTEMDAYLKERETELLALRASHAELVKALEDVNNHGLYEESPPTEAGRLYDRIDAALENAKKVMG